MECKACRFWMKLGERDAGECRRRAPVVVLFPTAAPQRRVAWPMTLSREWCGEFEPREVAG